MDICIDNMNGEPFAQQVYAVIIILQVHGTEWNEHVVHRENPIKSRKEQASRNCYLQGSRPRS